MSEGLIAFIVAIILVALSVWFGYGVGHSFAQTDARRKAISHGCASYQVTDTLTGTTEFQWRKPK